MFKFKGKGKRILSIVLLVGILVGCVALIVGIVGRNKADKGFELVKPDFTRGGLDANGEYFKTKESIYTKEAFECGTNVRVKIDFDSNVTYRVFFYDEDDVFIEPSDKCNKTETILAPENAVYARLVVTPEWDSDVSENNQVVRFWQVRKYAKQLTVMVALVEEAE